MRQLSAEEFLRDVQHHKMTVLMEQGLYRHVRFTAPENSWNLWFDLVTWPGNLTIRGDMGTWTFARLEDMFDFFRETTLRINQDYWSEKLQHGLHCGREGAKVWDEEVFKTHLKKQVSEYYGLRGKDRKTVMQALEDHVLNQDCKYDLLVAARDFSVTLDESKHTETCKRGGFLSPCICGADRRTRRFQFDTCELPTGMVYAYHFTWCCYAIVWGIQQWDYRCKAQQ